MRKHKKLLAISFVIFVLAILFSVNGLADSGIECYVVDSEGYRIDAFYASQKDEYYLFLTSGEAIGNITVHLDDSIVSASAGTVDATEHTLTGAYENSGDSVTLTDTQSNTVTLTVMQSSLPSLRVTLPDGTALSDVHADKNVKYSDTSVKLTDPSGAYEKISVNNAQFKGRGNSSWFHYEKKGYQIKFDKKTSVLGMPKGKKWVLLANACDDSMIKNYLAFDLAEQMSAILYPECQYCDLWINGDYRGTYLISEKVEIDANRVNLKDDYGALFEFDDAFYNQEEYWFTNPQMGHFTVKESVKEDSETINKDIQIFNDKLDGLFNSINTIGKMDITLEELGEWIDVESAADYYLINDYLRNDESIVTSFYWYVDGEKDVIHLGPVWDFDSAANTEAVGGFVHKRYIFSEMLNCRSFNEYVNQLYQNKLASFDMLSEKCNELGNSLTKSAEMNYIRWDYLGTKHVKGFYHDTYSEAISALSSWLNERKTSYEVFQAHLFTKVSSDYRKIDICLTGYADYSSVWFPTWSEENGQDDIVWYKAAKQADGSWTASVDLTKHNTAGKYIIHVYGGTTNPETIIANTTAVVQKIFTPTVYAEVSADCKTLSITIEDNGYDSVQFPTWSIVEGQDDIRWYSAGKNGEGKWVYTVDLRNHNSAGAYAIHVYALKNGKKSLVGNTIATVERAVGYDSLMAHISSDCAEMTISLLDNGYDKVYFPTWSKVNGQDDIIWYSAVKQKNDKWICTVDMSTHNSAGKYYIHAYAVKDGTMKLVDNTDAYASVAVKPQRLNLTVNENNKTLIISLIGYENYNSVYFPTWSAENGQDDIVWYSADKQPDGSWTYSVDLTKHNSVGTYYVHAYGYNGKLQIIRGSSAVVGYAA